MKPGFILHFLENQVSERKKCHGWPLLKLNFTSHKPFVECPKSCFHPKLPFFSLKISQKTWQRLSLDCMESSARIPCKTHGPPLLQTLPIIVWSFWAVLLAADGRTPISKTTGFGSVHTKAFSAKNWMIFRTKLFPRGFVSKKNWAGHHCSTKKEFLRSCDMLIGCKIEMPVGSSLTLFSLRRLVFEI